MAARIVNVRPKPGFMMDSGGEIIPTRQNVVQFQRDRLTTAMSGMGTSIDRATQGSYAFVPTSPAEAEASYRSSWLVRKIIDVPAKDMTREWRVWHADGPVIEKVEAEEKRLKLRYKAQRALILARLFGGGALILGTNDSDPTQPLNPSSMKLGGLAYVHVLSRWQLGEGGQQRLDPADPWFGMPEYFTINQKSDRQMVRLHPSRVVAFVGQKAPEGSFLSGQSWFWGDPIMQSIGMAVKNADTAQQGFASLIDRASVDILKVPNLIQTTATDDGAARFQMRLQAAKMGMSNWRMLGIDSTEEWQQLTVQWSGIPATLDQFLLIVAGAADIPMTRLLGQSPKGLQSTGDGEERDYHAMVTSWQEDLLAPALDTVDEVLIPSALGSHPTDVYYEFAPLGETNEKDEATIEFNYAQALKQRSDTGEFDGEVLAKAELNRMVESGRYPGLETAIEEAANEGIADPADQNEANVPPIEKMPPVQQQPVAPQPTARTARTPKA